jgi:hypothetical protein
MEVIKCIVPRVSDDGFEGQNLTEKGMIGKKSWVGQAVVIQRNNVPVTLQPRHVEAKAPAGIAFPRDKCLIISQHFLVIGIGVDLHIVSIWLNPSIAVIYD